jgi:hypothetical protein
MKKMSKAIIYIFCLSSFWYLKKMKNDIFLHNSDIFFLNDIIMKKNIYKKKKINQKIYFITSNIFFIIIF